VGVAGHFPCGSAPDREGPDALPVREETLLPDSESPSRPHGYSKKAHGRCLRARLGVRQVLSGVQTPKRAGEAPRYLR
jgi:hypothetical protein